MRITEEQIEQVRDATNIVDVVSEHVQLRKRGRNYVGLCPFHKEKTPSFNVLEDKGIFKCFGCGKGGDAFRFLMELEKLSFPEAIERLAQRANITLNTDSTQEDLDIQSERESIFSAAHAAFGWFYRALRSSLGQKAFDYVSSRRITTETLKRFGVGFAPEEPGVCTSALGNVGISVEALERAGIIAKGSGETPYERFRGRLIFPILSPSGRVIGFGGRVIPGIDAVASQAKYINSPETSIYHKSRVLYGLFQAKDAIRKAEKAYLVEGYLDVLAVSQAGVENVIAASGTALTMEQLELLRRYTKSVVLLFDADQAGKNAAMRGIELALEAGFDVNTVILPSGEDPDSFIRARGAEGFVEALRREQSFIETKAQLLKEQGMFDDPSRASGAIRSIVESIARVPDAIKRELYIRRLATRFQILESTLLGELNQSLRRSKRTSQRNISAHEEPNPTAQQGDSQNQDEAERTQIEGPTPEAEFVLLRAVIADSQAAKSTIDRMEFDLALISNSAINHVIGGICEAIERGETPDIASLSADFHDHADIQRLLIDAALESQHPSAGWAEADVRGGQIAQMAEQAIIRIESDNIVRKLGAVQLLLAQSTVEEEIHKLQIETMELSQKRESLKHTFSTHA